MSMVKTNLDHKRIRRLIWLVLTVFILLGYPLQSVAGNIYYSTVTQAYAMVSSPPVVLEEGNCSGTSTIYTNNTSAKVSVTSEPIPTYNYVLKVVNLVTYAWNISLKLYDNSNIARLSNTTISFHDGTSSDQIIISDGNISQSEGALFDLVGSATVYVCMSNLQATTTDTSYLYVYLRIQVPNTSTYILFIIVFEIT